VAGVKLLPFVENYGGSFQSIGPLAAAAFATVLEVSVLLGTPLGFALAASHGASSPQLVSATGSVRVKQLLGAALIIGLFWSVATSVLGGVANVELATPGRVANGLLETAREACTANRGNKTVVIPILGSRWRCNDSGSPTLVGNLTRSNASVSYSATGMSVSEDMTYVELNRLEVSTPAVQGRPAVRLTVEGAKLRGFFSLARPVKLGEWGRALFVAFSALFLSLLAVGVVGFSRASRYIAGAIGLSIALAAWLTLLYLDGRDIAGFSRYLLVLVVGAMTAGASLLLLRSELLLRNRTLVYRKQLDSSPS
jgi:hypothetical protein